MGSQRDWKRLAEYAVRRRAELGLTQAEVAHRGPLSLDRVQAIEGNKRSSYRLGTLVALERALEWADGSVERILAGGEPDIVVEASARLKEAARRAARGAVGDRRITDEEIINSGLRPETVEALLRMRRRIERLVAERDEDAIRRADRVIRALDEDRDVS